MKKIVSASRMFNWIWARKLEGSFPGKAKTGAYIISSLRVAKGWGQPPAGTWDNSHEWPPHIPRGIEALATRNRSLAYFRLRSVLDMTQLLAKGSPLILSIEINTDEWRNAPNGDIAVAHSVNETHTVLVLGYDKAVGRFSFQNSWGLQWGDNGYGTIAFAEVEKWQTEAWSQLPENRIGSIWEKGSKVATISAYGLHHPIGGVLHVMDVLDRRKNEVVGWGSAVVYNGILQVEELFVRPNRRNEGWGTALIKKFSQLSIELKVPIQFWISHADGNPANVFQLENICVNEKFSIEPSCERWAIYKTPAR